MVQHFYSERGMPLVYWVKRPEYCYTVPVLTVENYCKWYNLYLVMPNGRVQQINFTQLDDVCTTAESPWCDHVPNPVVVERLAEASGWHLCSESIDMIRGRWAAEVLNQWSE